MSTPDEALPPQPPPQQQPVEQLEQQPPQATCLICFEDIGPNDAVISCTNCHVEYHSGHIITWLTTKANNREPQTCPKCRGNMSWVLANPPGTPPGVQPAELLLNIDNWNM